MSYDDSMGVTMADGMVFANTLTYKPSQKLWVFSDHCATGGGTCSPLWTTTIPGLSYADQAPTVAGGVIYVPYGQVGHARASPSVPPGQPGKSRLLTSANTGLARVARLPRTSPR